MVVPISAHSGFAGDAEVLAHCVRRNAEGHVAELSPQSKRIMGLSAVLVLSEAAGESVAVTAMYNFPTALLKRICEEPLADLLAVAGASLADLKCVSL